MSADYFKKLETIFHKAHEIDEEKRLEFIKKECGNNDALYDELIAMFKLEDREHSLLDKLAVDVLDIASDDPLINCAINHYHIIEKIGSGGMGDVYLAEDKKLNRKVAIKFLPFYYSTDTHLRERFIREAQASAKLIHPNIITIHEISEHDKRIFMVLEFIEGLDLRKLLLEHRPDIDTAINIIVQICSALEKAHEAGIIHRDIKPENILVDNDNNIKVFDFGVSKSLAESKLTRTGAPIGTPFYMAPEQGLGKDVDFRADIYSVGVVLYEMLTGNPPFVRDNLAAILHAILHEKAEPISNFNKNSTNQLQLIVDKAIAKDSSQRYQKISDFKNDLLKYQNRINVDIEKSPKINTQITSLAVMYIQNRGDESNEFISYGITEDLIIELSRLASIRVTPMRSILKYKETDHNLFDIARNLEVDYILDGSLFKNDDNIRISAQLVEAVSNKVVWADKWEENSNQILQVKELLIQGLSTALNLTKNQLLQADIGTPDAQNSEAYEFYLRGKFLFEHRKDTSDIGIAVGMYKKALTLEPSMVIAKTGLVEILMQQGNFEVAYNELQSMLQNNSKTSALVTVHLLLAKYYLQQSKWLLAENHAQQGIELSKKTNDLTSEVRILGIIVSILLPQAKFDQALSHFDRILDINRHFVDQDKIAEALKNIGNIYRQKGDYIQAKNYNDQALTLARKQGNLVLEAACLGNLGNISLFDNEFEKALKNYQDALEINTKLGEQKIIQGLLANIAHIYDIKGQYHKAISSLEKATLISRQLGDERIYTHILSSLCEVNIKLGKFDSALENAELALKIALNINYKAGVSSAYQCLGSSYFWKEEYKKAFLNFDNALELAVSAKLPRSEAWVHLIIAESYFLMEEFEKSENSFSIAKNIADKIDEKTVLNISKMYLKSLQIILSKDLKTISSLEEIFYEFKSSQFLQEYTIARRLYGMVLYHYIENNEQNSEGLSILQDALSVASEIGNIPETIRLKNLFK